MNLPPLGSVPEVPVSESGFETSSHSGVKRSRPPSRPSSLSSWAYVNRDEDARSQGTVTSQSLGGSVSAPPVLVRVAASVGELCRHFHAPTEIHRALQKVALSQKLWIPQGPPVNQMVERSQALSEMVGHAEVVQAWLVQLVLESRHGSL